jgi:alkylation response protein AidB-like acyl-CoA dehydrogenase
VISFELTEEQSIAQSMARELARSVLDPVARQIDTDMKIPDEIMRRIWSTGIVQSQVYAREAAEKRSPILNALMLEELASGDAAVALAVSAVLGFVGAIVDQGSSSQQKEILPRFTGDAFTAAAVAVLEPKFQFDVTKYATIAERKGDDHYILCGTKTLVPLAAACSHFLVVAQSGGRADAFIVPCNAAGVKVAEPKGTLGLRGLAMADVNFDDVKVPAAMRLGEQQGCDVQKIIDGARAGMTAILTGMSRAVLDFAIPYLKERIVLGSPLARKQVIAFRLADMHIDIESMRWMAWRAASELEQGTNAMRSAQLAFTYAGQQSMTIADEALQAFGGHGFVRGYPIEMWYRNARSLSLLEGVAGL